MTAPIRVAFIGLSASAKTSWASEAHLPYLLSARGRQRYHIAALLNSSEAAAAQAIKHYGLDPSTKAYGSPDQLAADPNVDLVVCNTRVDVHHPTVAPSVKAGKAVWVEWPLAENTARATELADLADRHGGQTIIGLQARVSPVMLKIQSVLSSGAIGQVLSSHVTANTLLSSRESISPGLALFLDKKVGGNQITIAVGHMLDYVLYILGDFHTSSSHTAIQFRDQTITSDPPRPTTSDVPDLLSLHGTLEFTSERPYMCPSGATLAVHYRCRPPFPGTDRFVWTINGIKGELHISSDRGHFCSPKPGI